MTACYINKTSQNIPYGLHKPYILPWVRDAFLLDVSQLWAVRIKSTASFLFDTKPTSYCHCYHYMSFIIYYAVACTEWQLLFSETDHANETVMLVSRVGFDGGDGGTGCLLYTSPSPRD